MPHHVHRFAALTAVATALLCAPVTAQADAPGEIHVAFPYASGAGAMVATARVVGDVDGDGLSDTAAAVPAAHGGTLDHTVWVTFAPSGTSSSVPAGGAGWHGFAITG